MEGPLMKEARKNAVWAEECINGKLEEPAGAAMGTLGLGECRTTLIERIESQLNRSMREARKSQHLQELSYLLKKNPEVARILDLLEEIR